MEPCHELVIRGSSKGTEKKIRKKKIMRIVLLVTKLPKS